MTSKSELDFNKLPFEPYIAHFGAAVWEIWANLSMTYKWVSEKMIKGWVITLSELTLMLALIEYKSVHYPGNQ